MPASVSSRSSDDSSSVKSRSVERSRSRTNSSSQKRKGERKYGQARGGGYNRGRQGQVRIQHKIPFPPLEEGLYDYEQFVDFQKSRDVPDEKLRRLYQTYKRQWENRQKEEFFEQNKDEVWIRDKYHPESRYNLQEERNKQAILNYSIFVKQYNLGKLNPINLTVTLQQLNEICSSQDISGQLDNKDTPFVELALKENLTSEISEAPFFIQDPNNNTLYVKNVPPSLSRWTILEQVQQLPGFLNLSVSAPVKANDNQRMAWIGFDCEHSMNSALQNLNQQVKIKTHVLALTKQQERRKTIRVCSGIDQNKLYKDYIVQRELIQTLDEEKKIENNPLTQGPAKDRDDPHILRYLDLETYYLRKVHSYCYWSGGEFVDERMLVQKCGSVFLRVANELYKSSHDGINWQEQIQLLARKRIDDSKQGLTVQEPFQDILDKEICDKLLKNKGIKNSKSNLEVYPCIYCPKQFRGSNFLIKHIQNKHPQNYEDMSKEISEKVISNQMLETYKREKQSKIAIQKVIFGGASFQDEIYQNKKIVQPLNYAPRPQQRAYKDLDNIQTEKTIPQNIIIQIKESTINYNDI